MAAQFHKPSNLRYTEMCMYIDANLDKIVQTGEHPDIENKIFEYLYHILYALSCKQNFFPKFEDYDLFALYGASELYISMRNKQRNAGQIIRGKEVVPIKSCLNFIKSVLFPLKVNYTRQTFATVFNPELDQDTSIISENLKEGIRSAYRPELDQDLDDVMKHLPNYIEKIVHQTPYKNDPLMVKRLYISCQLTFLSDITIPNKLTKRLNKYKKNNDDTKLLNLYKANNDEVIL